MTRLLAALAFLLSAAAAWAQTMYVDSPGDGYLNLRTGPGSNHAIIGEMYHGEPVELLALGSGPWALVRHLGSGIEGYAAIRFFQDDPNLAFLRVNSPGDGYLNLRRGPNGSAGIIGRMSHGSGVYTLGERAGAWLLVEHADSGAQGWAHSRWLSGP